MYRATVQHLGAREAPRAVRKRAGYRSPCDLNQLFSLNRSNYLKSQPVLSSSRIPWKSSRDSSKIRRHMDSCDQRDSVACSERLRLCSGSGTDQRCILIGQDSSSSASCDSNTPTTHGRRNFERTTTNSPGNIDLDSGLTGASALHLDFDAAGRRGYDEHFTSEQPTRGRSLGRGMVTEPHLDRQKVRSSGMHCWARQLSPPSCTGMRQDIPRRSSTSGPALEATRVSGPSPTSLRAIGSVLHRLRSIYLDRHRAWLSLLDRRRTTLTATSSTGGQTSARPHATVQLRLRATTLRSPAFRCIPVANITLHHEPRTSLSQQLRVVYFVIGDFYIRSSQAGYGPFTPYASQRYFRRSLMTHRHQYIAALRCTSSGPDLRLVDNYHVII